MWTRPTWNVNRPVSDLCVKGRAVRTFHTDPTDCSPWQSPRWSTHDWRGPSSSSRPSASAAPRRHFSTKWFSQKSQGSFEACRGFPVAPVSMRHRCGPSVSPGWSTELHGRRRCFLEREGLLYQEHLQKEAAGSKNETSSLFCDGLQTSEDNPPPPQETFSVKQSGRKKAADQNCSSVINKHFCQQVCGLGKEFGRYLVETWSHTHTHSLGNVKGSGWSVWFQLGLGEKLNELIEIFCYGQFQK